MTWQAWVLGSCAMASTWIAIWQSIRLINTAKAGLRCVADAKELHAQLENQRDLAASFLNSCHLIAIHRNGRLNTFTFSRAGQIFHIETMGLLSDTPDEWRRQAGLLNLDTGEISAENINITGE